MNLQSTRLRMVEISWEDLDNIHHLHTIAEVDEFNTLGIPQNLDDTVEVLKPVIDDQTLPVRRLYMWKIIEKSSKLFIGVCGMTLTRDKFRMAEIYYKLRPRSWGKGYATEVAKTLIKSGFEDFGVHRIEAGVATQNTASVRVLEKAGMTREGLRRKILPIRGEWMDNYHFAIVEDDPRDY